MSPSEKVRALLDERGIEHFDYDANKQEGKPILETQWKTGDVHATYTEYPNKGHTTRLVVAWHPTPEQAIAVTVGNGTDLSKRLREVHGLHAFAELFGFDWHDESDWSWHDVACAMADAIDATVGVGTCHVKAVKKLGDSFGFWLSCGHSMVNPFDDHPDYCPWCGRRVIEEVTE